MNISPLTQIYNGMSVRGVIDKEYETPSAVTTFSEVLNRAVSEVKNEQIKNDEMKKAFVAGKIDSVEDVMIQSEKASLTLQAYMAVRGKLVDTYKEIMRIQI